MRRIIRLLLGGVLIGVTIGLAVMVFVFWLQHGGG